MASYCTLAELKNWLMPNLASTDLSQDASLGVAITAASRLIERYTGRRFYSTSADETLYFTASQADVLMPRDLGVDILSITTLYTDEDGDRTFERTWTATDFDLEPYNAASEYKPFTHVRVTPDGNYTFPTGRKGIKLAGRFGFCTQANIPLWAPEVRDACLMQASRLFERRVTPMGAGGSDVFGQFRVAPGRLDDDIAQLLGGYLRELAY
jgi:hypothetical protein